MTVTEVVSAPDLAGFCRRHHIRRLALFGSVLRPGDFQPDSDVDVLVDFEPGHTPGLPGAGERTCDDTQERGGLNNDGQS